MDGRTSAQQAPPATSAGMDHSEEMIAELDEPPDELNWSPTKLRFFLKNQPAQMQRRESLLTQQLHSETEHTDDEAPLRTLSTQSTSSNPSAASMAELTSDDGRSVASPAISPPLGPTHPHNTLPLHDKPLEHHVKIVGQDLPHPAAKEAGSEQTVEANLGRKRCISFACRSKQEAKPTPAPPTSEPTHSSSPSPPKRKCALKFVCPTRSGSESKPTVKPQTKRPASPAPQLVRKPSGGVKHRGSDSTVTTSPKSVRKTSASAAAPAPSQHRPATLRRTYSAESDNDDTTKEATRFHEFGTSDDEPEEWVQESTCHRSRLTVDDTLKKENFIRKTCEAAEEEMMEEDEDEEDEELDEELAAVAEMDSEGDDLEAIDEEDESDDGFHSDNEAGFASSDSENDDDSDYEWWKPGGASTAATSVEHLDRLAIVNSQPFVPGSSIGSGSSAHASPRGSKISLKKLASNKQTGAVRINRPLSPDLPDSTDFVCGTLDEDRPLEQAYINRMKMKDAAKRPVRPQDIDPSFPTSDPEMDEEDDDDVDEVAHQSEDDDDFMHGEIEMPDNAGVRQQPLTRPRGRSNAEKLSSPAPTRLVSPAPPRRTVLRSPPPPRRVARSPPPPTKRARSPAPRKLFGHSPYPMKAPAPVTQMTSPPNSLTGSSIQVPLPLHGLAERPRLTHTASLPRGGPITLSKLATFGTDDDEGSDTAAAPTEIPKRGAVDIVKGIEWKRQHRKKKLYQKMCAKAAAKGEKPMKVKPGKGAERMREVGLQLQQYHGKAEHILSL